MAEHGARVLALERETQFRDRVRGETVHPWGVAETRRLGIFDLLASTGANVIPVWERYRGPKRVLHRDLVARYGAPELTFYHPAMQEVLIQAAADAGAEVRRGTTVRVVWGGARPEALRARVLPLREQDPTRIPDHIVGGPDLPFDDTVRRRFFGEE